MKVLSLLFFFVSFSLFAYETDQYTLPPQKLKDLSSDISGYIYKKIALAVKKFNCEHPTPFESSEQVNLLQIAQEIYESIEGGVLLTETVEGWLGNSNFAPPLLKERYPNDYLSFRPLPNDSIYRHATYHRGLGVGFKYLFSATINLYGIHLGTDKLGHFFKQGHQYFELYMTAKKAGMSHQEAQKYAAYERGFKTERGIFGIGLSGVFSNADLFTNYTGMKFYQNLLRPQVIAGITYPAILHIAKGKLAILNVPENAPFEIFKRFVHPQMNEAMNPCFYDPIINRAISKNILRVCPMWKKEFPSYNMAQESQRLEFYKKWWGEDYGHSLISAPNEELITIGNSCFF